MLADRDSGMDFGTTTAEDGRRFEALLRPHVASVAGLCTARAGLPLADLLDLYASLRQWLVAAHRQVPVAVAAAPAVGAAEETLADRMRACDAALSLAASEFLAEIERAREADHRQVVHELRGSLNTLALSSEALMQPRLADQAPALRRRLEGSIAALKSGLGAALGSPIASGPGLFDRRWASDLAAACAAASPALSGAHRVDRAPADDRSSGWFDVPRIVHGLRFMIAGPLDDATTAATGAARITIGRDGAATLVSVQRSAAPVIDDDACLLLNQLARAHGGSFSATSGASTQTLVLRLEGGSAAGPPPEASLGSGIMAFSMPPGA